MKQCFSLEVNVLFWKTLLMLMILWEVVFASVKVADLSYKHCWKSTLDGDIMCLLTLRPLP